MKHLIALILMVALPAWAYVATPSEIRAECARQMLAGACTTKPSAPPAAGQSMVLAGVGRIDMQAWYDYASLFNEANPADTAMCDLALAKTSTAPGSDHDLYARAVWTPIKPEPQEQGVTSSSIAAAALALPLVVAASMVLVALTPRRRKAALA